MKSLSSIALLLLALNLASGNMNSMNSINNNTISLTNNYNSNWLISFNISLNYIQADIVMGTIFITENGSQGEISIYQDGTLKISGLKMNEIEVDKWTKPIIELNVNHNYELKIFDNILSFYQNGSLISKYEIDDNYDIGTINGFRANHCTITDIKISNVPEPSIPLVSLAGLGIICLQRKRED